MPEAAERTLVARDALAARQWEATLLDEGAAGTGGRVWLSPNLSTLDGWLGELAMTASDTPLEMLSRVQSDALWRRIIAESPESDALLEPGVAVNWAAEAWRLLADSELDPQSLRAARDESDFGAFLEWCAAYRARLADAGWIDAAGTRFALARFDLPRAGRITLLDAGEPSVADGATLRRLEARDWSIERLAVPARRARCRRVALADAGEELHHALEWAVARMRAAPASRIAVVLLNGAGRAAAIDRAIDTIVPGAREPGGGAAPAIHVHRRSQGRPLVAAALNLLELVSARGGFAHLSGWMRGPLIRDAEPTIASAAATLELELRERLLAQVGFLDAYRRGGLRNLFLRRVPELAERLDDALACLEGERAACSPARWAGRWQRALRALGWSAAVARLDTEGLARWERGLETFASLTPMLGELDFVRALEELAAILAAVPSGGAFPVHGIHVLGRIEDVGPGYDAAWVTGLTDTSLPEPARANPLLPRALQVARGMPWSTPADALRRGRQALDALRARVDELVLSWPASEYDFETSPSPLIATIVRVSPESVAGGGRRRSVPPSHALEWPEDPPPPYGGDTIKGGAHTLHLQARCPLRAFCQSRLGARALEAPERGISARHQGIVIHRALELLMQRRAAGEALAEDAVADVVNVALDERFLGARGALATLHALERERISGLIERFIAAEALRMPHRPEFLEQKRDIEIRGLRVRVRVDRMDRIDDGSIAILDYKTGRHVTRPGWFEQRLQDPQLPLYLIDAGARATSIVIAAVGSDAVRYLGVWPEPDMFPGRSMTLPEGCDWDAQRDTWRGQIETLVDEFGRGDLRLFVDDLEYAKAAYAPLTRFHEILSMRYREEAS